MYVYEYGQECAMEVKVVLGVNCSIHFVETVFLSLFLPCFILQASWLQIFRAIPLCPPPILI